MIQDGVLKLRIPEQLMNGVFQRSRTFFQPSSDRLVRGCTDERENQIEKSDANRDIECRKSKHKRTSAIANRQARTLHAKFGNTGTGSARKKVGEELSKHNTLKELHVKRIRPQLSLVMRIGCHYGN